MSDPATFLQAQVHRRLNPLTDEWVLVSPQRTSRPWQGQSERPEAHTGPAHDPGCYLCPGNARAGGAQNPAYTGTFVFDNDFAALRAEEAAPAPDRASSPLMQARVESGVCRVICYSPAHDLTLGQMTLAAIRGVVDTWVEQYRYLGERPEISAVTIFENRGAMMGASAPHPHGQVWANASIPVELAKETRAQAAHQATFGRCLLCEYTALELAAQQRIVAVNEHFLAVVPFWAVWPFETLVLPRTHAAAIDELDAPRRDSLAAMLRELISRYDALFGITFPYTMGLHQRPTDGSRYPAWHWHAHFYPPLLRSATVRKFMVGYEMLANPQRDITAEVAAARLRDAR